MTATQTPPGAKPAGRRRGRLALIGVGIMVAALAVGVLAGTMITKEPEASTAAGPSTSAAPSPTAATTTATTTSPASTANQANGCLGGSDPFAAILPAQQAASLDSAGAAAFARTFVRWLSTYPVDPAAADVLRQIVASNSGYGQTTLAELNAIARSYQASGYTEVRVIADVGGYRFGPGANTSTAAVDVRFNRQLTRNDGRVETQDAVLTVVLNAQDGQWHVTGTLPSAQSDPFADIPGAPWQSYAGAC